MSRQRVGWRLASEDLERENPWAVRSQKRIECGAGEMTGFQRLGQCSSVNQFAASAIHQARALFELRQGLGVDHFLSGRTDSGVQRNIVRAAQKIRERNEIHFEFLGDRCADVRIVGQYFISNARARRATSPPMRPKPTNPSVFPRSSVPPAPAFSQRPS